MHRVLPSENDATENFRHDRDHLRIQINLLEDAEVSDDERLRALRQQLHDLEKKGAGQTGATPIKKPRSTQNTK